MSSQEDLGGSYKQSIEEVSISQTEYIQGQEQAKIVTSQTEIDLDTLQQLRDNGYLPDTTLKSKLNSQNLTDFIDYIINKVDNNQYLLLECVHRHFIQTAREEAYELFVYKEMDHKEVLESQDLESIAHDFAQRILGSWTLDTVYELWKKIADYWKKTQVQSTIQDRLQYRHKRRQRNERTRHHLQNRNSEADKRKDKGKHKEERSSSILKYKAMLAQFQQRSGDGKSITARGSKVL